MTKSFTTNPMWNFNPNFGATWDPLEMASTVIRGGLQLAYDEANFYTTNRNHQNPPFATNVSFPTSPALSVSASHGWWAAQATAAKPRLGGTDQSPSRKPLCQLPPRPSSRRRASGLRSTPRTRWPIHSNGHSAFSTSSLMAGRRRSTTSVTRRPICRSARRWIQRSTLRASGGQRHGLRSCRHRRPCRSCRKDGRWR